MSKPEDSFNLQLQGIMTYPEQGWHKALFKWPVNLWRLGLAPVIGHHMMLITHTGRKSGLPRRTMTECYRLDGRKYAPCAFGPKAQWYKNISADPRVTIQTADGAESALAVRVTGDDEIVALFDAVGRRAKPMLDAYLAFLEMENNPEDIIAKKDRVYWFRFDPTDEITPPLLAEDLRWLWPLSLVFLVAALLLIRGKKK